VNCTDCTGLFIEVSLVPSKSVQIIMVSLRSQCRTQVNLTDSTDLFS
jgi:hypothetical protein